MSKILEQLGCTQMIFYSINTYLALLLLSFALQPFLLPSFSVQLPIWQVYRLPLAAMTKFSCLKISKFTTNWLSSWKFIFYLLCNILEMSCGPLSRVWVKLQLQLISVSSNQTLDLEHLLLTCGPVIFGLVLIEYSPVVSSSPKECKCARYISCKPNAV